MHRSFAWLALLQSQASAGADAAPKLKSSDFKSELGKIKDDVEPDDAPGFSPK